MPIPSKLSQAIRLALLASAATGGLGAISIACAQDTQDADQLEEITNFWQAGFAFGKRDRPIRLWFFRFDRLGLAYDISPSGELRGLKLVFRSLYEP